MPRSRCQIICSVEIMRENQHRNKYQNPPVVFSGYKWASSTDDFFFNFRFSMMSTSNPESHTTPATSLESDRINELAWKSFAAFINSGSSGDPSDPNGDTFKDEPDEDDYIRDRVIVISRSMMFKAK